jgi:RimJ/RimL family protein N-acetyltransferase
MTSDVGLRSVREDDLEVFYEQQREPEAVAMAHFPARERDRFFDHWRTRILGEPTATAMTITVGDAVAGNIGSWEQDGLVLVGYWLGKAYWGRGVATAALREFLAVHETRRPVHAYVFAANAGSIRVLEKCGFGPVEHDDGEELLLALAE